MNQEQIERLIADLEDVQEVIEPMLGLGSASKAYERLYGRLVEDVDLLDTLLDKDTHTAQEDR